MNNNNLYNTNNFIGITHNDIFKNSSNALIKEIYIQSSNSSNYASNISNVLDLRSSNFTSNYANIIEYNSSNYTKITSNIIQTNINKLIKEEIEHISLPIPIDLNHTYIYNSNVLGEIRFWCKSTSSFPVIIPLGVPDYRVKIDVDGKLKVYYTYDPLINLTFGNGWVDVGNSIVSLNAADANFTITIAGLEAQIQANKANLNDKIDNLLQSLMQYNLITETNYDSITATIRNLENITSQGARGSVNLIYNNIRSAFLSGRTQYFQVAIDNINLAVSQNAAVGFAVGIGGAAFFAICQAIQNLGYINTVSASINEYINSNVNLSRALKDDIIASNVIEDTKYYIEYCSNIYNSTLAQGFINTNINNIQYIPNLSTSNLYINTGNLNKLVASSSISENGILLSNKYLTSNHLYNLISSYSSERQYPSKLYTTTQPEDVVSLLGKLVYRNLLYLDNSGISYGSGFYEVFSSSTYDTPTTKNKLFNFNISETTNSAQWGISLYNSGTGNYQGDNSIDGNYYGDWVILKMPQPIMLTRYRIYQNTQFPNRSPSEWKVYGSNDGITFTPIAEAHQLTRLLASDYTFYYYNKALASTFTTQYQYIGFVFGKLVATSGSTTLNFAELQIFGKEIISNTINSNIYTTSNAVKGIVEFDMPIVCKHKAFYCQTSTVIYPNLGNTAYYKYDIDMRNYTTTGYIQIGSQSNDPYRIFRIRAFLGSCYFSSIKNGLPDILHYEIYMSYKAQAASGGQGAAGVNIYSIGYPNNPSLNIIPPNNIFILSNPFNDFNYITLVSTTPADIRVIIEDLIS